MIAFNDLRGRTFQSSTSLCEYLVAVTMSVEV